MVWIGNLNGMLLLEGGNMAKLLSNFLVMYTYCANGAIYGAVKLSSKLGFRSRSY